MVALVTGLSVAVVLLLVMTLRLARRGRAAGAGAGAQDGVPANSAPPTNVAVLTQYEMWMRRVEREQLGARDGHWAELGRTPQYAAWRRLAEARGAGDDVPRYMTRSLLLEVIYAAGGVEREFRQLREALPDGHRSAAEAAPPRAPSAQEQRAPSAQEQRAPSAREQLAAPPPQQQLAAPPPQQPDSPPAEEQPISRPYAAAPSVREASYSFVNLLSWARSTVERTDRPYRPGSSERAGLLPALARGPLRGSVEAALQHLRAALRDSRFLASYAFHTGAVEGEGTPRTEILPDGRIPQLADPLTDPALTWEVLEFTEHRDMLTHATEVMAAIEIFVERVLDAFAADRPPTAGPSNGSVGRHGPGELRGKGNRFTGGYAAGGPCAR